MTAPGGNSALGNDRVVSMSIITDETMNISFRLQKMDMENARR